MANLPITGTPTNVFSPLCGFVEGVSKNRKIAAFYLGRTNDLVATSSRHGCEEIVPMYQTSSTRNACMIEDVLIKSFYAHRKCVNYATHSGGCTSEDYINFVYIAVWFK